MLTVEHYSKEGKSLVYVHIDIFFGLSTDSQVGKILLGFLLSDASQKVESWNVSDSAPNPASLKAAT